MGYALLQNRKKDWQVKVTVPEAKWYSIVQNGILNSIFWQNFDILSKLTANKLDLDLRSSHVYLINKCILCLPESLGQVMLERQ
jgi:hypothetical protein